YRIRTRSPLHAEFGDVDGPATPDRSLEPPAALRRDADHLPRRRAVAERRHGLYRSRAPRARAGGAVPPASDPDGFWVGLGERRELSHRRFRGPADPDRARPRPSPARVPQRLPAPRRAGGQGLRRGAPVLLPLSRLDLRPRRPGDRHSARGGVPGRARGRAGADRPALMRETRPGVGDPDASRRWGGDIRYRSVARRARTGARLLRVRVLGVLRQAPDPRDHELEDHRRHVPRGLSHRFSPPRLPASDPPRQPRRLPPVPPP